jgi:pimeloyl-ACP methyl ester carboxylesterase
VAAAQEAMAARPDSSDLLAAISVPVLVLVGAQDAIVSPAEAERMAAAIPGARFEVVEGAGHLTSLERWEAFNAALAAFLD